MPLPGGRGTGLGKALKIIAHPVRPRIPIWVASLGEQNVAMTAEIADGWIPMIFVPEKARDVWGAPSMPGRAKRDPVARPAADHRRAGWWPSARATTCGPCANWPGPRWPSTSGGMGAKGQNFYNDVVRRYGYEGEAEKIQDLYLDGKKAEAEALVPDELLESMTICAGRRATSPSGSPRSSEAGVTHLQVVPVPTGDQRPGRRDRQGQGDGRLNGDSPERLDGSLVGDESSACRSIESRASSESSCPAICSISSASK